MKHLLYVSTTLPTPGYGSSVILYRHLKRLKDWKITILVDDDSALAHHDLPKEWKIIKTAKPKWWWPPVKRKVPGLLGLRCQLLISEYEKIIRLDKPDAILTQLGKNSLLAYYLSKKTGIPLNVIVHDRWQAWGKWGGVDKYLTEDLALKVLDHSARIWPVSPEMGNYYKVKDQAKVRVLYPIPEWNVSCSATWKDEFVRRPIVAFAGSYHSTSAPALKACAETLERLGGELWIVTKSADLIKREAGDHENIRFFEPFPKNEELLAFLQKNTSAILISGSIDTRGAGWELSFPSRLVEFVHTGLPVIIAGTPGTALANWAEKNHWLGYAAANNRAQLDTIFNKITDKELWGAMAEQSRTAAWNEFSAERIQMQFARELVAHAKREAL